jgi:peptidoglycan/LPS O-acetylase OafA/YrhL
MSYLGAISYSIYLYHPLAMGLGEKLFHKLPFVARLAPVGAIAAVIALASASYWLLELPLQKLRARFSPQQSVPQSSMEAAAALLTPVPDRTSAA